MSYWNTACPPDLASAATMSWQSALRLQDQPLPRVAQNRDLATCYTALTRQWLAVRSMWHRLHEAPVKNITALCDTAWLLDQLERGRAALLKELATLAQ